MANPPERFGGRYWRLESKRQGLGNKVIADMFGMALRSYHDRVQRLSESKTYRGRSLWEAVLEYVQQKTTVLRADVVARFHYDDSSILRSVLKDLVDSGILFQSGRGDGVTYRAASADELALAGGRARREAMVSMVWVAANRLAPATRDELQQAVPLEDQDLDDALSQLTHDGRIEVASGDGPSATPAPRV